MVNHFSIQDMATHFPRTEYDPIVEETEHYRRLEALARANHPPQARAPPPVVIAQHGNQGNVAAQSTNGRSSTLEEAKAAAAALANRSTK